MNSHIKQKPQEKILKGILYFCLILFALSMLFPFYWMVVSSFRSEAEIWRIPLSLFPKVFTTESYQKIFGSIPFFRIYLNSILFAGGVTFCSIILDSMTAYALAIIKVPGYRILLLLFIATIMVPFQITMIPLYTMLSKIGWLNTFAGLIIPRATSAFGIFLFYQFFHQLPSELMDAAAIDGCSAFRTYWKIVLPLSLPPLATFGIICFMANWNDFIWPLIVSSDIKMYTLPVALALFRGQHQIAFSISLAGATMSMIPILIIYIFAQRYFIKGIATTGLNG